MNENRNPQIYLKMKLVWGGLNKKEIGEQQEICHTEGGGKKMGSKYGGGGLGTHTDGEDCC
jgi:hypothetical protein